MKGFSVFLVMCAISLIANAIEGRWAFAHGMRGTAWVVLAVVFAAVLLLAARIAWVSARQNELRRLAQFARDRGLPPPY